MTNAADDTDGMSPATPEALAKLLGPPTKVDDNVVQGYARQSQFSSLAFDLYKETARVVTVAAGISSGDDSTKGFLRNQAICVGLLIRVMKFMTAVLQLISGTSARREVLIALTRSILESTTNVRYLLLKNDEAVFDQFVTSSLGPERELYDFVQAQIKERGGTPLQIESRMLWSMDRACRLAGVAITDVPAKSSWVNLRERFKALGDEQLYLSIQRMGSHAVHGTWSDLILHHLEETADGRLAADPEWGGVDPRILCPPARLVLEAVHRYITHYLGEIPEASVILQRIEDLSERLRRVDEAHEAWMSARDAGGSSVPDDSSSSK